jgi:transposase-like protein
LEEAIPKPQPKYRPVVAVDETKLKRKGEQLYIWAAIDVQARRSWLSGSHGREAA